MNIAPFTPARSASRLPRMRAFTLFGVWVPTTPRSLADALSSALPIPIGCPWGAAKRFEPFAAVPGTVIVTAVVEGRACFGSLDGVRGPGILLRGLTLIRSPPATGFSALGSPSSSKAAATDVGAAAAWSNVATRTPEITNDNRRRTLFLEVNRAVRLMWVRPSLPGAARRDKSGDAY
ncbi:hypothetical protein [Streptomyces sp. NPDC014734]|uniref:hypothetical protein n=1 Tax=Streptomyces sp. NPDC014734 TaxID=3364886 RepID=UPI00370128C6